MSLSCRWAETGDAPFCERIDAHVSAEMLRSKLLAGELAIAEKEGHPVGYIRLEYLWLKLPFIGLIEVLDGQRREGIGTALLAFLEKELRLAGYDRLLSSVLPNATCAREWHEKQGFGSCGTLEGVNRDERAEIFLLKRLA